jgi:hypothetical protein
MKITWLIALVCSGCAVDGDAADDAFSAEGKADTGGIVNGSPEAIGVLRVANERSRAELTSHGVATNAANNIAAVRAGDDLELGTTDDTLFTTLAELDAVPYVGPLAFARMLAYARSLGYVPAPASGAIVAPADLWHVDESCQQITYAQLLARFPAGKTYYEFPAAHGYAVAGRSRQDCNAYTGCSSWRPDGVDVTLGRVLHDVMRGSGPRGRVSMNLDTAAYGAITFELEGLPDQDLGYTCGRVGFNDDGVTSASEFGCDAHPMDGGTELTYFFRHPATAWRRIHLVGKICADGRFHFRTQLAEELGVPVTAVDNLYQLAIYGQL